MFQNSNLGNMIADAGWNSEFQYFSALSSISKQIFQDFYSIQVTIVLTPTTAYNDSQNTRHVLFGEYQNTNGGILAGRVGFAKTLTSPTDISTVLPGYKTWVDSTYIGLNAP